MSDIQFEFTPVVIIGAGRSGTNALRDMLTRLPQFGTWNCDEINPIWRHGNLSWPNDEIPAENATQVVRRFIRNTFRKIWTQSGKPKFVVEKTCANSLRVPFVDSILPDAKYIYIVRSGVDVVFSARKRWQGDLELPGLPYFFAKMRYTPILDLPIYGWSFLKSRVNLVMGNSKRLSVWGPRYVGMDEAPNLELEEICARQWAACVERADEAFTRIDPARVFVLKYEAFASEPKETLSKLLDFLGADASESDILKAIGPIRATSINKGKILENELSASTLDAMMPALHAHGYVN